MNLASVVVLLLIAAWAAFSIVHIRKKDTGGCDGNCGSCAYSCIKADEGKII